MGARLLGVCVAAAALAGSTALTAIAATPPTAGPVTGTAAPELVSAAAGVTTLNSSSTPAFSQTTVSFAFDEPVTGGAPVPADFHLVGFDANWRADGQSAAVQSGGDSVLITFGTSTAPIGQQQLLDTSIASVSNGAVTSSGGLASPIGSVPLGSVRTVANQAGVTAAPDLISVGDFAAPSNDPFDTLVTFTFDKPAWLTSFGGLHLALQNGTDIACGSSADPTGTGPTPTGSGTTTISTPCPNPGDPTTMLPTPITASEVARGYAAAGSVSADPPNSAAGQSAPEGSVNPLQSADVSGPGATPTPYLKSLLYMPNVTVHDSHGNPLPADQVGYVFDQPVTVGTATSGTPRCALAVGSTGVPTGGCFLLYTTDARQLSAADPTDSTPSVDGNPPVVPSTNPDEVLVTFPAGTLATVAGGAVGTGAVTQPGGTKSANEADSLGQAFPGSTTFTPGSSDGPLLTAVEINTTASPVTATYVFDQDLGAGSLTTPGDFYLLDPGGTQLACTTAVQATGGAPGTNNTVTCSKYQVQITGGGTATTGQLTGAVVGTVDHNAVTTNPGAAYPVQNPEGAHATGPPAAAIGPPTVTGVNPSSGSAQGGTEVTITGTNLTGTTAVDFGPAKAQGYQVNSAGTQITAISPPGTASATPVNVTVTTPVGTSPINAADEFTYTSAAQTQFSAISPTRVYDSRSTGPLAPGSTTKVDITDGGRLPIPTGASAVALNVTAVLPTGPGYLEVFPDAATFTPGLASTVNFQPGASTANFVIVPLVAGDPDVDVYLPGRGGPANAVVDVFGYFNATPLHSQAPQRITDTRPGSGSAANSGNTGDISGPVAPNSTSTITVAGNGGVPASGAKAVLLNVTAVGPTGDGNLQVYPDGSTSDASTVNFIPNVDKAEFIILDLPADGKIDVIDRGSPTNFLIDVYGYFDSTSALVSQNPTRVLDTRPGSAQPDGLASGPLASDTLTSFKVAGAPTGGVPTGAESVLVNIVAVQPLQPAGAIAGNLRIAPDGTGTPPTSNLNYIGNDDISGFAVVSLAPDGDLELYSDAVPANVVVDVLGWFPAGS
ncbi:MAG: IPT/TIG domain-containing protein [Mycobacteriales bacterium]